MKADSQPREAHTLSVTLRPERAGTLTSTLRLHTDLPGRGEVQVTITATVLPPE